MRDILFMGEVLASVTHDMQNIMAIIKESGALADDILALNGPPRMKHGDKLAQAQRNIQEQVLRGRDLMLMLNGFAHAAADFPASGDLSRFSRQITVLAERMVRLKDCRLEKTFPDKPLAVRGNALMIMQAIYVSMAAITRICTAGDVIRLTVDRDDGGPFVRLGADQSKIVPEPCDVAALMTGIGGSCNTGPGHIVLRFAPAPQGGLR